jgi:ATP-dependent protease ClpP protease subunit
MKKIVIDGQIGPWQFSKQYVREMLKDSSAEEVDVNVSSLGGDVNHAIDIHDQFATHGNITVTYTGMNASSATLLSLSAKKVRMSENSFYLIHKPMFWVDMFDNMNEDDIDATIAALEKQKNELAKFTLVLARMYKDKTGMAIQDILNLMKEDTWLTADQAKAKGFVDEVFKPSQVTNYLEDANRMAMIAASGLPVPGRKTPVAASVQHFDESSIVSKIENAIRKIFNPSNKMKKQFKLVNAALKVEKLEGTDEGIYLNEAQLEAIEADLTKISAADAAKLTAETEKADAVKLRDTAVNDRTAAVAAFDAIDVTIASAITPEAKVAAVKALLAKKPGTKPAGANTSTDPNADTTEDGVDWEVLNNLSHMKIKI